MPNEGELKLPAMFYLRAHNARRKGNRAELRRWIDWAAKRLGGWQVLELNKEQLKLGLLLSSLYRLEYALKIEVDPVTGEAEQD